MKKFEGSSAHPAVPEALAIRGAKDDVAYVDELREAQGFYIYF